MSEISTNWSKPEFKAYLMLYAANANFVESEEEREVIQSMLSSDAYKAILREIAQDNDYQSIQKILYTFDKFEYDKTDLDQLIQDMKAVFNADGHIDLLEENMLRTLKHLLK